MRKIKFRARNANVPRCWIYGYFIIEDGCCYIVNEEGKFPVICDTQGQYTGLKANDVEIYEGDIVTIKKGWKYTWVVEWRNYGFICRCVQRPRAFHSLFHKSKAKSLVVIGNIYSNPELLEA